MAATAEFERLVNLYYPSLYRFAFSLTHQESDACDLTQQTFYIWARKGDQLQDHTKVKSWLFTTLHREFLQYRRKFARYSDVSLSEAEEELPEIAPLRANQLDAPVVLRALAGLGQTLQAPIALFYLEDYSYGEIASILEIPLGTVKSRISRGLAQLQQLLSETEPVFSRKEAHG